MSVSDDERLADWTDELLNHVPAAAPPNLTPEEQMVVKLEALIRPNEPMNAAFRTRLSARLNEEFEKTRQQNQPLRGRRVQTRLYAIAAAVMIALLGLLFLMNTGGQNASGENNTGTATATWEQILILLAIGTVVSVAWWWWANRR